MTQYITVGTVDTFATPAHNGNLCFVDTFFENMTNSL